MRILGIDYGAQRVGLALGDTESKLATPWKIIPHEGSLSVISRLRDILLQEKITSVVVGMPHPLRQSTTPSAQMREVLKFTRGLKGLGVDVHHENEALTSRLAAHQAQESGASGAQDDLAAAAILQTWLDRYPSAEGRL